MKIFQQNLSSKKVDGTRRCAQIGFVSAITVVGAWHLFFNNAALSAPREPVKVLKYAELADESACDVPPATNEEMEGMSDVLLLKAGVSLQLNLNATGKVQPGGRWRAEYGEISATGYYTAPSYTPLRGIDDIQYFDPNNRIIQLQVRILPNKEIANSEKTPYEIAPWSKNTADYIPNTKLETSGKPILVLEPGEKPSPPLKFGHTKKIKSVAFGGLNVYYVPAILNGFGRQNLIYINEKDGVSLSQAKVLPEEMETVGEYTSSSSDDSEGDELSEEIAKNNASSTGSSGELGADSITALEAGKCKKGERIKKYGPWKTVNRREDSQVNLGEVTLTPAMTADILKIFKLTFTAGFKQNVIGIWRKYTRTRIINIYKCKNGRPVFVQTKHCEQDGTALVTIPDWAVVTQGFPANGGIKWSQQNCS